MMLNIELYASLMVLLPPGSSRFRRQMNFESHITVKQVIEQLGISNKDAHIVLVNGHFVCGEEREQKELMENDTVAVWPPVAGG